MKTLSASQLILNDTIFFLIFLNGPEYFRDDSYSPLLQLKLEKMVTVLVGVWEKLVIPEGFSPNVVTKVLQVLLPKLGSIKFFE